MAQGIYVRGQKLWFSYATAERDPETKKWKQAFVPSGFAVGQEASAAKALAIVRAQVRAQRALGAQLQEAGLSAAAAPRKGATLGTYGPAWHRRRQSEKPQAAKEDAWKLTGHIYPALGGLKLDEMRPRHARQFVMELRAKKAPDGSPALAPRTIRAIWSTLHTMMHDAVADELIPANPCVLKRGDLPAAEDKDPEWRSGAVFERHEVEQLISDERIPLYRRTLNALLFLGGFRPSEAFALRVKHYDRAVRPLGRLDLLRAFNTRERAEKGTKTGKRRLVPVHPTLAQLLGDWLLSGWAAHVGRRPDPDDLLVPSPTGAHLRVDDAYEEMLADQALLGWRKRRLYDARRTFHSLALADGANRDLLRWVTYGAKAGEVMDLYTSIPWDSICAEVSKLRVSVRRGTVVPLRRASGDPMRDIERDSHPNDGGNMLDSESRHPDLNRRPTDYEGVSADGQSGTAADIAPQSAGLRVGPPPPSTPATDPPVTLSRSDAAGLLAELRRATDAFEESHDAERLRQRLEAVLGVLRGGA